MSDLWSVVMEVRGGGGGEGAQSHRIYDLGVQEGHPPACSFITHWRNCVERGSPVHLLCYFDSYSQRQSSRQLELMDIAKEIIGRNDRKFY